MTTTTQGEAQQEQEQERSPTNELRSILALRTSLL